jgi:hypothetical protein
MTNAIVVPECADPTVEMQEGIQPPEAASAARIVRAVPGMGTVYDYRGTGLLGPNGGRIRPLLFVQHIPVYPNKPGTQDFIGLAGVLKAQGLALQSATDRDGNVALYNRLDALCWQARGANSISCGCEHMHMTVNEKWTKRQMRAAAWLAYRAWRDYGIPPQGGKMSRGRGQVGVVKRGHVSHHMVSVMAGFNDREDPGPHFDWSYLWHCVRWYDKHLKFVGA